MRFRIVNDKNNEQKSQRSSSKDPSTRQNSANKHQRQNSFLEMVRNSYDFYMTVGRDQLKNEQLRIAAEREEKLKKTIKKQTIADQRQIKKVRQQKKAARMNRTLLTDGKNHKHKLNSSTEPSRRSQRNKNSISYRQPIIPIEDEQIFNVLDMEQQEPKEQKQVTRESNEGIGLEGRSAKSQAIIARVEKVKQELIFEQEGSYELGAGHETMLRAQKFIDEHLNFRHQIRQSKFVQIASLLKYVRSHGFLCFDEHKFSLLMRINPYLYTPSDSDDRYLMTFKLNGLEIDKRLESTRRRMGQVSLPELMT